AGLAAAESVGPGAMLKWPNDVLLEGRKVAGVLIEGRPQEDWAVVGIGINVALTPRDLPEELQDTAGGLGKAPDEIESTLAALLGSLEHWLPGPPAEMLAAWGERDVLRGREVRWAGGVGRASGVDGEGRL